MAAVIWAIEGRDSERKSRGWSTWDNASRESGRDGMPARHSRVSESPMI